MEDKCREETELIRAVNCGAHTRKANKYRQKSDTLTKPKMLKTIPCIGFISFRPEFLPGKRWKCLHLLFVVHARQGTDERCKRCDCDVNKLKALKKSERSNGKERRGGIARLETGGHRRLETMAGITMAR